MIPLFSSVFWNATMGSEGSAMDMDELGFLIFMDEMECEDEEDEDSGEGQDN